MGDALAKPFLARVHKGRIEAEALKDLEGAEVIVLPVANRPGPDPANLLKPGTSEWAELANLCGCSPEELEQVLDQDWDSQAARKRFQKARRYGQKQARQLGLHLETEEDVLAYLAQD